MVREGRDTLWGRWRMYSRPTSNGWTQPRHGPGNLIFCSMLIDGGGPDEIAGTVTISSRLRSVPLLPRAYEVWVAVDSATAHEYLEWQPVASFRVGEPSEPAAGPASQTNLALGGPIHVPHDWEIA